MIINSIKLINFRNYQEFKARFYPGINFLHGNNATGKTSLAEAIYFLSIARSFRTANDDELILRESEFASIFANLKLGTTKKNVDVYLTRDGKKIAINKKQIKKISELSNIVNCIYFIPEEVDLLRGSPKDRRLFLNLSISKVNKHYLELMTKYEKLLKERNVNLKEFEVNVDLVNVLTKQMIEIEKQIYIYRKEYIALLNKKIKRLYKTITGDKDNVEIIYEPFINNVKNYEQLAELEYKNSLEQDIKRKVTNKGIQKEDFYITKNGRNVGIYGSQGENRMVVIALKLTPYELIDEFKYKPIVILDDVFSELDKTHQDKLIKYLKKLNQVFITSTTKLEIKNTHYFKIENGKVVKGD